MASVSAIAQDDAASDVLFSRDRVGAADDAVVEALALEQGARRVYDVRHEETLSGDPRYYQLLGKALARGGDLTGAIAQYRKARDSQSDLPGLLFELGQVYLENGDNVRALMIFNEALELHRGATFQDRQRRAEIELLAGRALVGLGEGEKALVKYYRSAAALDGGAEPEQRLRALFAEIHGRNLDPRRFFAGLDPVPWPDPVFFSNLSGEEGRGAPGPDESERGGVAWGDFDRDGDADLLIGGTALYVNAGRGGFKAAPESLGFRANRTPLRKILVLGRRSHV